MPSSNFGCYHCILLGRMIQDLTAVVTGSHFLTFSLNFLLASSYAFSSYTVFVISRASSLFPPALLQTCISSSLHPAKLNRKCSFSFLRYDPLFIFLHPQQTLRWLKHPASLQVVYKSADDFSMISCTWKNCYCFSFPIRALSHRAQVRTMNHGLNTLSLIIILCSPCQQKTGYFVPESDFMQSFEGWKGF